MNILRIVIMVLVVFSLQACNAMRGEADAKRIGKVLELYYSKNFTPIIDAFVKSGQEGDVDKMVSLTSESTIEKMGLEGLKKHYDDNIIPVLKTCLKILDGSKREFIRTKKGKGWIYYKVCHNEETSFAVRFTILRENERFALTSFRLVK